VAYEIDGTRCNGCGACARQCPAQAILPLPPAVGPPLREPYVILAARCTECGVCGMICPLAAVRDGAGRLCERVPRPERPRPVVDPLLCNGCGTCVDGCPTGARGLEGHRHFGRSVLARPLRCVSCGECVRLCLKEAVALRPPEEGATISGASPRALP
jgi:ferredoxin